MWGPVLIGPYARDRADSDRHRRSPLRDSVGFACPEPGRRRTHFTMQPQCGSMLRCVSASGKRRYPHATHYRRPCILSKCDYSTWRGMDEQYVARLIDNL